LGRNRMNARPLRFLCVHVLLLCASAPIAPGVGAGVRQLSVEELAVHAEVIAVGTIVAVTSAWNTERTQISTRVELRPEEMLKGATPVDRISFVQLGGRVGNIGSAAAETPSFTEGERVVLFLARRRNGQLAVMALSEGKFNVEREPSVGVDMAIRRTPGSGQILERVTLETLRSRVRAALGR
jgi:hypothetical protein